jgi:hypothetical protein
VVARHPSHALKTNLDIRFAWSDILPAAIVMLSPLHQEGGAQRRPPITCGRHGLGLFPIWNADTEECFQKSDNGDMIVAQKSVYRSQRCVTGIVVALPARNVLDSAAP